MSKKRFFEILAGALAVAVAAVAGGCSSGGSGALTSYVDPKIGSGGHGHVFVGANVPFGMVQVGPVNVSQGWDWCSGYHDSDSTVIGFAHTHLSGTGCGDLLDVALMPVVGRDLRYERGRLDSVGSGLWSYADRSREIVRPGYYSVPLTRYGVLAEMTSTSRAGFHRYTFPASDESAIVIDLQNGGGDLAVDFGMEVRGDRRITGHRHSKGWADNQKVYFVIDFSRPFESLETPDGKGLYGRVNFRTGDGESVLVKVGLSAVSEEGAIANLESELPGWDFEGATRNAAELWEKELSKVRITGGTPEERKIFYTALYHTMVAPSEFCDVNGDYRGADGTVVKGAPFRCYTTYSLWDTYRAAMPLLSITQPERYSDMINTMTAICGEQGRLPVWHLWGCETDCMVGNPALPVVADAIVKDIPGVDKKKAYEALIKTAMDTVRGNGLRQKYGYIPFDLFNESVAYDMEYALADWAVGRAALAMGDSARYAYFTDRSKSYRNYFDPSVGFMRGKDSKGRWRDPFNEFDTSHRANDYCEGNAWQYTWLAPHDIDGLRGCFGSQEKMLERLDSLFTVTSELQGDDISPDVAGFIGQYAHGNEPGHHTAYLYAMAGEPEKTADLVREILSTMYSTDPDGLSGNEDVGQMSAWYVLSSMGLYEVEPGSGRYWFGSPLFEEVAVDVPGGVFRITAHGNSPENRYVAGVLLDGKEYNLPYIDYSDIMRGAHLEFMMSADKINK